MKTVSAYFDQRFSDGIDWKSIPGLDDMSPGTGEARAKAREACLKLAQLAVGAFKENGLKVLAIEFGVISKGATGEASLYTSFVASKRYSGIFVPRAHVSNDKIAEDSTYLRAMHRMAKDVPPGSSGPEPIVTHPALQDPNLDCVFVIPDDLDEKVVGDISDALNGQKSENYIQSDQMVPIRLKRPSDYTSNVQDRMSRFRELFIDELKTSLGDDLDRNSIPHAKKVIELHNSIMGVIPLFRSDYYDKTQIVSNNKIANIFATDVAGVVLIAWAVPNAQTENTDRLENRLMRSGRAIADLFSAVALRDVNTIAMQAHRAIGAVRTAYHDIYNLISKYSSRMSAKRLFFDVKGNQSKEYFRYKVQQRSGDELDEELGPEESSLAAQALDDFAFVRRMTSQAAILEVQWGGTAVRTKFQGLKQDDFRSFSVDQLVHGAFEEVREIEAVGHERKMAPAILKMRKHTDWIRPKGSYGQADPYQFIFPQTYVSYDIIIAQIFEIFLNSRKHALPNADGFCEINVEILGEYLDGDLENPRCVIKIWNNASPLTGQSKKESMLSLINGISVDDKAKYTEDGKCIYEVKIAFGAVISEVDGGLSCPRFVI